MAADDSLATKKRQASNFVRLEIEKFKMGEGKGLGRSYIPDFAPPRSFHVFPKEAAPLANTWKCRGY